MQQMQGECRKGIEGVESVSIDLASGEAVIKGSFDEASMKKAVESLGFKVTIR